MSDEISVQRRNAVMLAAGIMGQMAESMDLEALEFALDTNPGTEVYRILLRDTIEFVTAVRQTMAARGHERIKLDFRRTVPVHQAAKLSEYDRENVGEVVADAHGTHSHFGAHLLRLINKADAEQREVLRSVYPEHVAAVDEWERTGM